MKLKTRGGFTLVELMIVIVIIGLLASVAVFSALRARMKSNEGSAKASLKSLQSSLVAYRSNNGEYPSDLATLGADYAGGGLENGELNGFEFNLVSANNGETFTVIATPATQGFSGIRGFCTDVTNAVYSYSDGSSLVADGTKCPSGWK